MSMSAHTISKWLESIGSQLHDPEDDLGFTPLATSAFEMTSSPPSGSPPPLSDSAGDSSRSSTPVSVRGPRYRELNLGLNGVRILNPATPLPGVLAGHVAAVQAPRNGSPGLPPAQLSQTIHLIGEYSNDCDEVQVASLFNDNIFLDPQRQTDAAYGRPSGLACNSNALMAQHLVPAVPENNLFRISRPKPDRLYGYPEMNPAFTASQMRAQRMLYTGIPDYAAATARGLHFPFFAIEFKAAAGTGGNNLWVATNQCAGASATCLGAVEQLNMALQAREIKWRVDSISYAAAIDNSVANLFIAWKDEEGYCLQRICAFMLERPAEFASFRSHVRNILDWGKGARLEQIKGALDAILEAEEGASEAPASKRSRRGKTVL